MRSPVRVWICPTFLFRECFKLDTAASGSSPELSTFGLPRKLLSMFPVHFHSSLYFFRFFGLLPEADYMAWESCRRDRSHVVSQPRGLATRPLLSSRAQVLPLFSPDNERVSSSLSPSS